VHFHVLCLNKQVALKSHLWLLVQNSDSALNLSRRNIDIR